ncbi:hypothetical protein DZB84_19130 [Bacillus sp. HNG]|nr:hypothetical protein DZB84_19130 [Bacillus sp. HNG]
MDLESTYCWGGGHDREKGLEVHRREKKGKSMSRKNGLEVHVERKKGKSMSRKKVLAVHVERKRVRVCPARRF